MTDLFKSKVFLVWLFLCVATAISWWLGTGSFDPNNPDRSFATISLMIVAFIKVRFVGIHFMELGHAPQPLRGLFEAWVLLVCASIIAQYLFWSAGSPAP